MCVQGYEPTNSLIWLQILVLGGSDWQREDVSLIKLLNNHDYKSFKAPTPAWCSSLACFRLQQSQQQRSSLLVRTLNYLCKIVYGIVSTVSTKQSCPLNSLKFSPPPSPGWPDVFVKKSPKDNIKSPKKSPNHIFVRFTI